MASTKLLVVLACALTLVSVNAQNTNPLPNVTNPLPLANVTNPLPNVTAPVITNPLPNVTAPVITNPLPNVTAPVITNLPFPNAALPASLNTTALNANVSNATLAIYRAVRAQSLALLGALGNGSIVQVVNYVTPDVQLFLPNTTGPVVLANASTLLPFLQQLTPPAGTNTSINNVSELYFYVVDNTNVVIVDEASVGQLGNHYITGFFSLLNSTTSPLNGTWLLNTVSITPAPSDPYIPQPTPRIVVSPNITLVPSLNTSTINVNGTNQTVTLLNSTLPANITIRDEIIAASDALQTQLGNVSASNQNITSQFFASWFQVVLPTLKSPSPLNLSDPNVIGFLTSLRGRNATGTAPPQTVVAYRQLNTQAGLLTTLLPALPGVGDVYVTQLWQYLNTSSGSNTTTGVNTTILPGTSRTPLVKSWQLTFGAVNLAPDSAAPGPMAAGAPVPAPAPTGGNTPVASTSTDTPSPTSSTGAPGSSDTPSPTSSTGAPGSSTGGSPVPSPSP